MGLWRVENGLPPLVTSAPGATTAAGHLLEERIPMDDARPTPPSRRRYRLGVRGMITAVGAAGMAAAVAVGGFALAGLNSGGEAPGGGGGVGPAGSPRQGVGEHKTHRSGGGNAPARGAP